MLEYSEQADSALTSLELSPDRSGLLIRIARVLDRIDAAPGDADVRQHRLVDSVWGPAPTWVVTLSHHDEEWAIVWFPTEDSATQVIAFIGPVPS